MCEKRPKGREINSMKKSSQRASHKQVIFSFGKRKARGTFEGGDISGLGGLPIFQLLERNSDFVRGLASCIKETRRKKSTKHSLFVLIWQAVLLIIAGHAKGIECNHFKDDPILRLLLASDGSTSSQASRSRLENMVTKRDILRCLSFLIRFYIKRFPKMPSSIELNFDGSAMQTYGRQQHIAFNSYYDKEMYFPLFVFDQSGWLLGIVLRGGAENDGKIALPILQMIVKRLRRAWPQVEILFRADAAFGNKNIFQWCEQQNKPVKYVLGLRGNNNLYTGSRHLDWAVKGTFKRKFGPEHYIGPFKREKRVKDRQAQTLPGPERIKLLREKARRVVRSFGEFMHQMGNGTGKTKNDPEIRVIAKSEHNDTGAHHRYIATNVTHANPTHIYETIYGEGRGRTELNIREFKSLEVRLSCSEALANQFRLILHLLAHNFYILLREILPTHWAKSTTQTLQRTFCRIAVQVKTSSRQLWLRWTSSFIAQQTFLNLCNKLHAG